MLGLNEWDEVPVNVDRTMFMYPSVYVLQQPTVNSTQQPKSILQLPTAGLSPLPKPALHLSIAILIEQSTSPTFSVAISSTTIRPSLTLHSGHWCRQLARKCGVDEIC